MFLFKASGKTYMRVVRRGTHAFAHAPTEVNRDELVLLSKNREDCRPGERQIRFVGKIHEVRVALPSELDHFFPGMDAAKRWQYTIRLYNVFPVPEPFDLAQVPGLDAVHFRTVQGFSRLSHNDQAALVSFLISTNPQLVIDILNAEGPPDDFGED